MSANKDKTPITIDEIHLRVDIFQQPITQFVWNEKYRWKDNPKKELHPYDSFARCVDGVYAQDSDKEAMNDAFIAMKLGLWNPGGRIHAGAGTSKVVTLMNCYVDRTIEDSMVGIADALKDAMLTQQQGGGIGMHFGTLRPSGATLQRTGAIASGPLPFMDMWDAMCTTIRSAGDRRGAMMATMCDDHPDLPKFITAKHEKGKLTNFNISVLVTDAFMEAVQEDASWALGFCEPKHDGSHLDEIEKDGKPWYIYEIWSARDLWNLIMESTYEYSEPGVIFIDRVNEANNLRYCEEIMATNPCGEQPLPPNGACNLGAVNLARMVRKPFQKDAYFDFTLLCGVARIGVRFLDNVIDVTNYPLEAQREEMLNKRRIGLGITGLANAIDMLGMRYGSPEAIGFTEKVMKELKHAAYDESSDLAQERGSFRLWDPKLWAQEAPIFNSLPAPLKKKIRTQGMRNGVILTIAPTGTTSLYYGNISSGLEPVFAHTATRNVRVNNADRYEPYEVNDYGYNLFRAIHGPKAELPPHMVTAQTLEVADHVRIQATCQAHVDASISKTINCPKEISFEAFQLVYLDAFNSGCKGCTTYRPSEVRGSILSTGEAPNESRTVALPKRPDILRGTTYKVKWPSAPSSFYVTINDDEEGAPFEIFITSTNAQYNDWTTALSLMISAIMRKGGDISFIPAELRKVHSAKDAHMIRGKFYGSLVARLAEVIEMHIEDQAVIDIEPTTHNASTVYAGVLGEYCPSCGNPTMFPMEGCMTCTSCAFSKCG